MSKQETPSERETVNGHELIDVGPEPEYMHNPSDEVYLCDGCGVAATSKYLFNKFPCDGVENI